MEKFVTIKRRICPAHQIIQLFVASFGGQNLGEGEENSDPVSCSEMEN